MLFMLEIRYETKPMSSTHTPVYYIHVD